MVEKYKDRSQRPMPHGGQISKIKQYSWATPRSPGLFKEIKKQNLVIDTSYQRGQVSKQKVLKIAKEWDWALFGTISVIERKDGVFAIVDGGNRWRAASYRKDINALPCMVFQSKEMKDEAKMFVGTNTMVSNVSAFHKHRASVIAEEPTSIAVESLLEKYGYRASQDHGSPMSFSAISTLTSMVKSDPDLAERVFQLCAEISDGEEHITRPVLLGIFYLAQKVHQDILAGSHRDRLITFGIKGIATAIQREKHILGKGGEKVSAKAVLDLLNKHKRKKLRMDIG